MIIEAPRFQGIAPTAGAPAGIMLLEGNPAAANGAPPSYSSGLITSAPGVPTGATPVFPPLYIDNTTGVLHWYDGASWIAAQFGIGYVDTVADLSTIGQIVDGSFWHTSGYHTNNDQGGNLYRYDATSAAVCDGGFVLDGIGGENILAGATAATYPGTGVGRFFITTTRAANVRQFGALGNAISDAFFRIQAAINTDIPIILVPRGQYLLSDTLLMNNPAQNFTSESNINADTPTVGARLVWGGAANGTMMIVSGDAVRISGIRFNAANIADTCISFLHARGQGFEFCSFDDFIGDAVLMADVVPNYNGFYGENSLFTFGNGGTAIRIDATGTENIAFRNISITRSTAGNVSNGLIKVNGSCHVNFYNLVIDDFDLMTYAMQFTGGATFGIWDLTSECRETLSRSTAAMSRPCTIIRADLRSCAPGAGDFVLDLSAGAATVPDESSGFVVSGIRIRNLPGAAVIPQIRVRGATCHAGAVFFEEQAVSPGRGSFVVTSTGHVANMSYGNVSPNFQRLPLTFDADSPIQGMPAGASARMLWWIGTTLRVGDTLGTWTDADYDVSTGGKHTHRAGGLILTEADATIADGETALLLRRNVGGVFALERVLMGAPDSGSVLGRRALEVLN